MKIGFHGAARDVTGSQHRLTINGAQVLLDCGMYHGRYADALRRNTHFPFDPARVDAMILSHAHIDHSGNIPNLVKQGFSGPIHATDPTVDLAHYMLLDSAKIQESDAAFWAKRNRRRGLPVSDPLYTVADAEAALGSFVGHRYAEAFEVVPGVRVTLRDAGHILGSAITVLDIEELGRRIRLAFSGDLGRKDVPLLRDPKVVQDIDYVILESTYGNRLHEPPAMAYDRLRQVMAGCCGERGKVIIPSFAVGRAQDLIYSLHRMMDAGEIDRMPVFVDSPLAVKATNVFRKYPQVYDEETHDFMHDDPHGEPLTFPELTYVSDVEESKALNGRSGPMVIISAAGMANAGRVLHHLRNNIEDRRNTVLIVSWQAPNTLGRRLVEGQRTVKIFGEEHRVRAKVEVINGFSAHADRNGLLAYADALKSSLKGVFIVHGEEESALALQSGITALGIRDVFVPELNRTYEV